MITQTPEEVEQLKLLSISLLRDAALKPRISKKDFRDIFPFDFSEGNFNSGAVLLDTGGNKILSFSEWELFKIKEDMQKFPFLNFLLLDYSVPYKIVTWEIKKKEGLYHADTTRFSIKVYRPYKITMQPDFEIGLKKEKEMVFYRLSKGNVDVRVVENQIHRLAKISDQIPLPNTSLTAYLEETFPIYKELKQESNDLPITWNEALLYPNKRALFSQRLHQDAGKKANKRSYFANYIYTYMVNSKRLSSKELARFDNWISTSEFSNDVIKHLSDCDKRSYKRLSSLYRVLLVYYLSERYGVTHDYLRDVVALLIELEEKDITFNFTSEKGFCNYHDHLTQKLRDRKQKKDRQPFSVSKAWHPFVQTLRYKKKLKRLKSPLELVNEGGKMHHCVGGYSEWVKAGECIIYHYDAPGGTPYTLEFTRNDAGEVVLKQMYGKYNTPATEKDKTFIHELLKNFNENTIKEQIYE